MKLTSSASDSWYLIDLTHYAKKGKSDWFKYETISWKILASSDNVYSLVSTLLFDAQCCNEAYDNKKKNGHYANNYANSETKAWLNGDFLNSAFYFDNSLI